ncbi:MAG: sensor histidine kinase [Actinomycetota bacterium]|nr:sensor histidine kinase [Actinomycetota bacterium]
MISNVGYERESRPETMKLQPTELEISRSPAEPASVAVRGRWLFLVRAGWLLAALALVGLFVAAVPARYEQITTLSNLPEGIDPASVRAGLERSGLSIGFYAAWRLGMEVVFAVVCLALGPVIFWRRSNYRVALFVSLLLVLLGTTFWNTISALSLYHPAWERVGLGLAGVRAVSLFLLFYIFPDGRFMPRWTRWLAAVLVLGVVSDIIFPESPLAVDDWPIPLFILFMLFWLLTGVFAQVYRYRRVSGPVERQQAKWVIFGFTAAITGLLGVLLFGEVLFPGPPGTSAELFGSTLITLFMLLIPASIGTAILRYRLFDIDVFINRTLVYGSLTACVVGAYILIVGYLGALFQARGSLAVSLIATGIVAVLFVPLRDRLQRGVNRLMYGERDEPYAVISRLGERLEATLAPEAALSTIVETVAGALKLPYAAITLKQNGGFVRAAEYGTPPQEPVVLPLAYQSDTVGQLILSPRSPGESFSPSDKRLLEGLSRQAGVTAHAVRLTADLQRSREQLVSAREEERRRLRRDLHDGLGPRLAAQTLKAGSARSLYPRNPAAADALLLELEADMEAAIAEVRRLLYDLRPPALDELGLMGAIRETAARYEGKGLSITVEAPAGMPPLPAAVEVAAYRIAQEAVTNVVRHARADSCLVRLSPEKDALELEVSDDGVGLPEDRRSGVGLHSMRERAGELGGACKIEPMPSGGTRVLARLPLPGERGEEG